MQRLGRETMRGKRRHHLLHAEQVAMVVVDGPGDVVRYFVHLKKSGADAVTRHTANLRDGGFHSAQRQVFQQVVKETKIKGPICCLDLKRVAHLEPDARKKRPGIGDVLLAKIKPGVINVSGQATRGQKPIIVRRSARRFDYGDPRSLTRLQNTGPKLQKCAATSVERCGTAQIILEVVQYR